MHINCNHILLHRLTFLTFYSEYKTNAIYFMIIIKYNYTKMQKINDLNEIGTLLKCTLK